MVLPTAQLPSGPAQTKTNECSYRGLRPTLPHLGHPRGRTADPKTLLAPGGTQHEGLHDAFDLERDWSSLPKNFVRTGGVFLEAISCCFKEKSAAELAPCA